MRIVSDSQVLSLVIMHALLRGANEDYEFIVAPQKDPRFRLTKATFTQLVKFFDLFRENAIYRELLEFAIADRNWDRTPDDTKRPNPADFFFKHHVKTLEHIRKCGSDIEQALRGEATFYTMWSKFISAGDDRRLLLATSLCDIAAAEEHEDQFGSRTLTEALAQDFLTLVEFQDTLYYAEKFYKYKARRLIDGNFSNDTALAAVRLSLMCDRAVHQFDIVRYLDKCTPAYNSLVAELNLVDDAKHPAILPLYGHCYLRNIHTRISAGQDVEMVDCLEPMFVRLQNEFVKKRLYLSRNPASSAQHVVRLDLSGPAISVLQSRT